MKSPELVGSGLSGGWRFAASVLRDEASRCSTSAHSGAAAEQDVRLTVAAVPAEPDGSEVQAEAQVLVLPAGQVLGGSQLWAPVQLWVQVQAGPSEPDGSHSVALAPGVFPELALPLAQGLAGSQDAPPEV
jgi:hypothetical protein